MRGVPGNLRYERIVMGDEGVPHGVQSVECVSGRQATGLKPVRWERPVPPIMAM